MRRWTSIATLATIATVGLAAVLGMAGTASAEVRRIEEVGAVPVRTRAGGIGAARDAAVQAALHAAVGRVARGLLMEAEPASGEEPDADELEKVLGKRMVPYTTRFRVLEDRGERPAMSPARGVRKEYVVVVEVYVDADRVEQRLVDAGLLARGPLAGELARVQLELRGVEAYDALAALRSLLTDEIGATSVVPVRFERGVAVLDVALADRDADPGELADRLVQLASSPLRLRALEIGAGRAVLQVAWQAP